jgi:hypothetical protein
MPLAAAFYASHHILVKGAMFMLVGVLAAGAVTQLRGTLLLAAILAMGLGGLPLTGGAVAKLAVKDALGSGWPATVAYLSAIGTTLLMLHFLRCARAAAGKAGQVPTGLYLPWLVTALAALAVPWSLFLALPLGTVADVLEPKALIATTWPVLVGVALAWMLARWGTQLPKVPAGDVAAIIDPSVRAAIGAGALITRLDTWLRQWAVAGSALLLVACLLVLALQI